MSEVFKRRTRVGAPAEEVFGWHARPGALERLTPPFSPVEVVERNGGIADRARVVLKIPLGPTHVRWVAEHQDYIEGRQFRDVQVEGPFARWKHTHRFEPDGPHASFLEDRIDYALPFGAAGALVGGPFVRDMLDRMFTYRHHTTVEDIATHAAYPGGPLHIAVSGSTGLVGSALIPFLTTGGHRVTRLVRSTPVHPDAEVRWDPTAGTIDAAQLEGINAIVHLAGENIAAGRWTEATKARIKESRLRGTRLLCESAARLQRPPKVLVCASAIGYYGDRGATVVDEDSPPGTGFLAEVCSEWEAATAAARASGIRVVQMRLGVVLTAAGGALAKLLLPFQLGTGGRLGSGEQYMSWVSLDDVIGAILHALRTDVLEGPVNA
ncbi:MAG TPA: TIGR01777 family oxidoreductase, partial [Mycobacterium sp.]|nr:TIGR01777 family oxidoreductase [Mycobacterium sp.]